MQSQRGRQPTFSQQPSSSPAPQMPSTAARPSPVPPHQVSQSHGDTSLQVTIEDMINPTLFDGQHRQQSVSSYSMQIPQPVQSQTMYNQQSHQSFLTQSYQAHFPVPSQTIAPIPEDKHSFDSLFDLCAYLDAELELHESRQKQFDFQTVYDHLSSACKKWGFKLEDVRERNGFTLLHVLIAIRDVKSVAMMLQNPNKDPSAYIPANVRHLTTRNLLYFCAFWSKPAMVEKDKPSVNARLIEIAKLLSDPSIPNYLPLDLKMTVGVQYAAHAESQGVPYTVRRKDGSTHAHKAAKNGAADLLYFFHSHSTVNAYYIKRDDGRTPLDLAREFGHRHIQELAFASVKKANVMHPALQTFFVQKPAQTQSVPALQFAPKLSNENWLGEFAQQMGGDGSNQISHRCNPGIYTGALLEEPALEPAVTTLRQGMK